MEYIKICGLKNMEDIQLCIDNGANALGFIYNVPESPRNLSKLELENLLKQIPKGIKKVIIIKANNTSEVLQIMNDVKADLYQIHCKFDIRDLDKISSIKKKKIIVALRVDRDSKEDVIRKINHSFDQFFAFLIDNSEGNGAEIDNDLVLEIRRKTAPSKIIVAGGINISNVEEIISYIEPYGIDVSSSLEKERGVKDPKAIKVFLEKIKKINHN